MTVQDKTTFETYPMHPLGPRDSWPETGPIYDLPVKRRETQGRTFWSLLGLGTAEVPAAPEDGQDRPPVYY
jgi:hypothetical protein